MFSRIFIIFLFMNMNALMIPFYKYCDIISVLFMVLICGINDLTFDIFMHQRDCYVPIMIKCL